jgi:hypothetical protein
MKNAEENYKLSDDEDDEYYMHRCAICFDRMSE